MNYLIHQTGEVFSEQEQSLARLLIEEHVLLLGQHIANHTRPVVMDFYFSRENQDTLVVSSIVNLDGDIIYIRETGDELNATLQSLFEQISLAVVKKNYRKRKLSRSERKEQQMSAMQEYVSDLKEMKTNQAREVFNHLLKDLLKDVARYIRRRIKAAEMTTAIRRGKFKIQELLDELYLMIYERIDDIPETAVKINHWLYQMADELLAKLFREVEFEKTHFKDLGKIVESEYRSLQDAFTIDAEQEIIPMEELDEYHRKPDWYAADDLIFGEDEDSLLDEITLHVNQKEIHMLIEKELAKLPIFKRTIMDLYLINQLSVEEIAAMKEISTGKVEDIIEDINKDLKRKLAVMI